MYLLFQTDPNTKLKSYPRIDIKKYKRGMQYCSVCASRGHFAEFCPLFLRIMQQPITPIEISSYEPTYKNANVSDRTSDDYVPFALISAPEIDCQFNWDVDETPERFYGRFMKAVNFDRKAVMKHEKSRNKQLYDRYVNETGYDRKSTQLLPKDNANVVQQPTKMENNYVLNPLNAMKMKRKRRGKKAVATVTTEIENKPTVSSLNIHSTDPDESEFQLNISGEAIENRNDETNSSNHNLSAVQPKNDCTENLEKNLTNKHVGIQREDVSESLVNFSFTDAMEELQNKQNAFNLSFITPENCNTLPRTTMKKTENPIPFAETNSKNESVEIDPSASAVSVTINRVHDSPDSNYSFSDYFHTDLVNQSPVYDQPHAIPVLDSSATTSQQITLNKDANTSQNLSSRYKWQRSDHVKKIVSTEEHYQKIPVIESRSSDIIRFDDDNKMPEYIPLLNNDYNVELSESTMVNLDNLSNCSGISLQITERSSTPIAKVPIEREQKCDAKIYLTKDHTKYLTNEKGTEFLRDASSRTGVVVLMGYENIGNFLTVSGLPSAQNDFHVDLSSYFKEAEKLVKEKTMISQRVPKARTTLVKFIKDQMLQLDRPLGDVKCLYKSLQIFEGQNSKTGNSRADKCRKTLNMILLGQTGLLDGQMHLFALQSNLRYLMESTREIVSPNFRNQVFQHCRYIFSSYDHKDYEELVKEYVALKQKKQLPSVNLDRKLLGLKINVHDDDNDDPDDSEIRAPTPPTAHELHEAKQKLLATITVSKSTPKTETEKSIELAKNKLHAAIKAPDMDNKIKDTLESDKKKMNDSPNRVKTSKQASRKMVEPSTSTEKTEKEDSSSSLWSRKCLECIEQIHALPDLLNGVKEHNFDLDQLEKKAGDNKLTYRHYRLLLNFIANTKYK